MQPQVAIKYLYSIMKKIMLSWIPKLVTVDQVYTKQMSWVYSRNMLSHETKSRDVATVIVQ